MMADFFPQLVNVTLAVSAAIVLALVLRRPLRRLVGAQRAYALWLVVPAAMIGVVLPWGPALEASLPGPAAPAQAAAEWIVVMAAPAEAAARPLDPSLLVYLWAAGAAGFLLFLAYGQWRALARFGLLGRDPDGFLRAASSDSGPALVGLLRPAIVLPTDFETRFEPREQAMVLAHERAHLSGGHLWINALTALIRALNWFNPLVHIGAFYARVDQELACDAAVVERFPGERRTYAGALLKTQLAPASLPLGCYWPGRSSHHLNERISMLARTTTSRSRRLIGALSIAAVTVAAGVVAWAATPQQAPVAPGEVSLTNSLIGGGGVIPGSRAEIERAAAAGDLAQVLALGGAARDALDSILARGPMFSGWKDATDPQFVVYPDGYVTLAVRVPEGHFNFFLLEEFRDFTAPPGTVSICALHPAERECQGLEQVKLPAGPVNLSNAGTGDVLAWGSQRKNRDDLAQLIAARDARAVFAGGGTPEDMIKTMGHDLLPFEHRPKDGSAQYARDPATGETGVTFVTNGGARIFGPLPGGGYAAPAGAVNYAQLSGAYQTPEVVGRGGPESR